MRTSLLLQQTRGLSHPPSASHRGGTCEGIIRAKALKKPKLSLRREDTGGDKHEKGTRNSYSEHQAQRTGRAAARAYQFIQCIIKTWNSLPWEVAGAKSINRYEKRLDKAGALNRMIWEQLLALKAPEMLFVGCWGRAERRRTSLNFIFFLHPSPPHLLKPLCRQTAGLHEPLA